ncbi:type I restriction-modification system specificity determinant protein [Komagataeibacter medellinensis NBRC 3288]|uniref:Type I restriction-modification system specificity determinant protein n=1 Tax=Komagataeibacter medellinensis (strain NBRC 3288 / BCRC 11682 / LMG 1693 / Kondo 51) TaxID=634177 RepID=G2I4A3_KOMMN|nr:type I restriction-modification system specificity determinant protein [Komagataeibacter medellinensis NBRC 3288]
MHEHGGRQPTGVAPWPCVPLGALVDCLDARRIPLSRARRAGCPGSVPYHGASGVVGHVDRALFDGPLVLLGEDCAPFLNPVRDVAFFHDGPLWAGNHVHVLRPRAGVDGRFVAHALNTIAYGGYVEGTTRPKLVRARMNSLPVPCPPLDSQRRIARELDGALERIDCQLHELSVQRVLLREQADAALWHAVQPGHGHTARLLGSLFDIVGGGTPPTDQDPLWGGDIPWITPADLPAGPPTWLYHGARSLSAAGLAACRATLVPPGALVVSTRAPVGRVGMLRGAVSVSQGCKALVPRGADVALDYAALLLRAHAPILRQRAGGSVFAEVDTATLASLELSLPPLPAQHAAARTAWASLTRVAKCEAACAAMEVTLREYRPALRRAWVSGMRP